MIFGLLLGDSSGANALMYFVMILMSLVAAYLAIVPHEIAHGLVALWNGDPTAKYNGRLTMNPVKHFDLIGFIMMFLMGFGYAKPVPVNPGNFKHYKRGLFAVAIAGIATNIIIAFLSTLFYSLCSYGMFNVKTDQAYNVLVYLKAFFQLLASLNLSLAFFNLLPIFPLDGYRMIESFTSPYNRFCRFMRVNGRYILYGLIGLSLIISMASRYPIPSWFRYFDILGTYRSFFAGNLYNLFINFWRLMIPGVI
ncbi:MAG: site-2 protease family protein [Clostridiales bacterium]|nr:site-2 protease family protein [Clostridiales bacterium]